MKLVKTIMLILTIASTTAIASPSDVIGKDGLIRVTLSQDKKSAAFELCMKHRPSCLPLGSRRDFLNIQSQNPLYFSIDDLKDQRSNQSIQTTLAVVGDIVGGAALITGGGALGGWALGTLWGTEAVMGAGAAGVVVGGLGGGIAGVSATIYLANAIDHLNPSEQFREGSMLADDIITDKDISVNRSILNDATSLNLVLLKVSPVKP